MYTVQYIPRQCTCTPVAHIHMYKLLRLLKIKHFSKPLSIFIEATVNLILYIRCGVFFPVLFSFCDS